MTLVDAFYIRCAAQSAITDLVSTRIYRTKRPQNTALPALVYLKTGGKDETHQSGGTTLARARLLVECWASTPSGAEALRDAVRDAWHTFAGTITSGGQTVTVLRAELEDDGENDSPPQDASDQASFLAEMDLSIWYRVTAAAPT